ncbi:hypothetical protein MYX76_17350 [Desulfobacterota bacterium AH_259_B03_O07]|nr:hypothetical protein [Desulfobacterota bacterium AH_259_B03_O07]
MSLKTRIKKLERACGGDDGVVFIAVVYGKDNPPAYVVAMVNNHNEKTDEIIQEYKHEHPWVEVRVSPPYD